MLNDSIDLNSAVDSGRSTGLKLLAILCALLITGALLVGYALMRKRHAQTTIASAVAVDTPDHAPKGPPKVQIIVDEPLLRGSETIIGGQVKNISGATLSGLGIRLELRQRKGGELVESLISVEPSTLEPDQEGGYSVKMPAHEYASVRLIGLTGDPNSKPLAYSSLHGKQRPPERIEPKTIVVTKRSSKRDDFLNSPDNPARVP